MVHNRNITNSLIDRAVLANYCHFITIEEYAWKNWMLFCQRWFYWWDWEAKLSFMLNERNRGSWRKNTYSINHQYDRNVFRGRKNGEINLIYGAKNVGRRWMSLAFFFAVCETIVAKNFSSFLPLFFVHSVNPLYHGSGDGFFLRQTMTINGNSTMTRPPHHFYFFFHLVSLQSPSAQTKPCLLQSFACTIDARWKWTNEAFSPIALCEWQDRDKQRLFKYTTLSPDAFVPNVLYLVSLFVCLKETAALCKCRSCFCRKK